LPLSYKDVAEIIKLVDASRLDELIIELPDSKLVVRRHGSRATSTGEGDAGPPFVVESPPAPAVQPPAEAPGTAPRAAREDGLIEVRAPMVGTFYRAPSPKDKPFVEVGSAVKTGDPLCLIEVMKLFTTVEAERPGRVVEIAAANASLVEYGQVLFVLEPAT
jgi:acetyl-CoA carboxylase biotin carboxyl carrier protein